MHSKNMRFSVLSVEKYNYLVEASDEKQFNTTMIQQSSFGGRLPIVFTRK